MASHSPVRFGSSELHLTGWSVAVGVLSAALVASLALNVLLLAGDSRSPETNTTQAAALPGTPAASTPVTPAAPLPVGATMGLGTIKLAVDRVFTIPSSDGRALVGVEGTVENGGLERVAITAAQQFHVVDRDGVIYGISIEAMRRARELGLSRRQEWSADLAPGQVFKGFIAFDLPAPCDGMTFQVAGLTREARWVLDPACDDSPAS